MATPDDLVRDYLDRLSRRASSLAPADRDELVAQVTDHIAAARAAEGEGVVATRNVLDRLGTPEEIVDADTRPAGEGGTSAAVLTDARSEPRLRWQEIAALVLLPLGGFVFLVGWLVGVILLWSSDRWRPVEKVLGTLVWPFGYLAVAYTALAPAQTGIPPVWVGIALAVVLLLAPVGVLSLLARRAAPRRG